MKVATKVFTDVGLATVSDTAQQEQAHKGEHAS
ncbi:hypothetical protein SAMN05421818_11744 [Myroides phaeus]|uniref:Uncharacterized protein n=1 Tax=Myroides phaeus TaxID=702745 RepID=A0A1G8FKJ8_9FLAO|nr:hypothetical protein SAMN05421818_11744 [Myroides phaeus]